MLKKYPELKKPLIGLALSVAIFIGLVVCVAALRRSNPRVPISETEVTITDITVNDSSVRIDWECDNTGVTSYQIFRKVNAQSNWTFYKSVNAKKHFIDSDVNNQNTYGYYVRAFDSRKKSDNYSESPYIFLYKDSDVVDPPDISEIKPQLTAATNGDKVTLSWEPIENVPLTSICVYYKENGDWKTEKILPPNVFSYEEIKRGSEYKIVGRNFLDSSELRTEEAIVVV